MRTLAGATGNGPLDCALRSRERITAQVWSSTDVVNANTTAYRLSENGKAHIQFRVGPTDAPRVKFRCLAEEGKHCIGTRFKCTDDQGMLQPVIDAGKVERLDVYTLSQSVTSDYRFPDTHNATVWYSCDVVSSNPFMVHTTSFSTKGSGQSLVNTTAISME